MEQAIYLGYCHCPSKQAQEKNGFMDQSMSDSTLIGVDMPPFRLHLTQYVTF